MFRPVLGHHQVETFMLRRSFKHSWFGFANVFYILGLFSCGFRINSRTPRKPSDHDAHITAVHTDKGQLLTFFNSFNTSFYVNINSYQARTDRDDFVI